MAWNDDRINYALGAPRRGIDMSSINARLDASADQYADVVGDAGQRFEQYGMEAAPQRGSANDQFDPAEFAINQETGEIATPWGQVVKGNAMTVLELAEMKMPDGSPMPRMSQEAMNELQNRGFRPYSQQQMRDAIAAIPAESDFWGATKSSAKQATSSIAQGLYGLGMAVARDVAPSGAAIVEPLANALGDTSAGRLLRKRIDQARNPHTFHADPNDVFWSDAEKEHIENTTIAKAKTHRAVQQGEWYGSKEAFLTGAGKLTGNIVPHLATAVIPGGALLKVGGVARQALVGGAAGWGEQSSEAYEKTIEAASQLSTEELAARSPEFAELLKQNPQLNEVEARELFAQYAGEAAGAPAAAIAAGQAALGAKYLGHLLPGVRGWSKAAVPVTGGLAMRTAKGALRVAGKGLVGGVSEAATEMAESALGQSAAGRYTGLESGDFRDHINIEEGLAASQGGILLGMLGGRRTRHGGVEAPGIRFNPTEAAKDSDIGAALGRQSIGTQQTELTPETDVIPSELLNAQPQNPSTPESQNPEAPQSELDEAEAQITAALDQNFGPEWRNDVAAVESDPAGARLIQSLRDIETLRGEGINSSQDLGVEGQAVEQPNAQQQGFVGTPEPQDAPQERMSDGRPVGVSPDVAVNPEPMHPGEAVSRQAVQAERGQVAPEQAEVQQAEVQQPEAQQIAPVEQAALAEQSRAGVPATTPEPVQDVRAQVDAMLDPRSERDAVFVAEGTSLPEVPEGVQRVQRRGVGTLLTTNPAKAQEFMRSKLNDESMARILGYSEDKATAVESGSPVAVQAVTQDGAVSAEQLASPDGVQAAGEAVAAQGVPGSQVRVTSPVQAQVRRSQAVEAVATPEPAAAQRAVEVSRAKSKGTLSLKKPRTATEPQQSVKAQPAPKAQTPKPQKAVEAVKKSKMKSVPERMGGKVVDAITKSAKRRPASLKAKAGRIEIGDAYVTSSGLKGHVVDLRTALPHAELASKISKALRGGELVGEDDRIARGYLNEYKQVSTMMKASLAAAETRLESVAEAAGVDLDAAAKLRSEFEGLFGDEKPKASPVLYLPLVKSETEQFITALRDEAKAELKAGYNPRTSVARRMISSISDRLDSALDHEHSGRKVLSSFAKLTDDEVAVSVASTHNVIKDSILAKQVVRGAAEVAYAQQRFELAVRKDAGPVSTDAPASADHSVEGVRTAKLPYSTEHGTLPTGLKGVVDEWVKQFEKGGHKFQHPVHVMDMQTAAKLAPEAFVAGARPNGKFIQLKDQDGKTNAYALAVDWDAFQSKEAAMEVLAHEFGHVATVEIYNRLGPGDRAKVNIAYTNWLSMTRGMSAEAILRDQLPPIEKANFSGTADYGYSIDFWEWSARNAAKYLLDPNRPHLSAVDKFFKAIADAMRKVYASVVGGKADKTWVEMIDRYVGAATKPAVVPPAPKVEPAKKVTTPAMVAGRADAKAFGDFVEYQSPSKLREYVKRVVPESAVTGKAGQLIRKVKAATMTVGQVEQKFRGTEFGKHFSKWVATRQKRAVYESQLLEKGSVYIGAALNLSKSVRNQLEAVMYDATRFGIHPEVAFTDDANAHLRKGNDNIVQINERRHAALSQAYREMVNADNRTAGIYAGLKGGFVELRKKNLKATIRQIAEMDISAEDKKELTARVERELNATNEGPYFPLVREGEWIVKVALPPEVHKVSSREEARKVVAQQKALHTGAKAQIKEVNGRLEVHVHQQGMYMFGSEYEANSARKEIMEEIKRTYAATGYDVNSVSGVDADGEAIVGISKAFQARPDYADTKHVSGRLNSAVQKMKAEGKIDAETASMLNSLAAEAQMDSDFRKSMLPRQSVLGGGRAMLSGYAKRYKQAAAHTANMQFREEAMGSWDAAWAATKEQTDASEYLKAIMHNEELIAERARARALSTASRAILQASGLMSLGFNAGFTIIGAAQPWMTTMPVLAGLVDSSGRGIGAAKAAKYLKEAYAGTGQFIGRGMRETAEDIARLLGGGGAGDVPDASSIISKFAKTREEAALLENLRLQGQLDFGFLNSIQDAVANTKLGEKFNQVSRAAMALPQQVEVVNRMVTALAGYRLAKDAGLVTDFDSAASFVRTLIDDTQLDYSAHNRPWVFNHPVLGMALQFKIYVQGMLHLFYKIAHAAVLGKDKAQRRQARRQLGYLMGMHAAIAGSNGMGPVSAMLKGMLWAYAQAFGDEEDKWKTSEQLMREFLQDTVGKDAAELLENGVPGYLFGVDLSDRLAFPNLVDPRFANVKEGDSSASKFDAYFLMQIGPVYSNTKRLATTTWDVAHGDFSRWENVLPTGIRAPVRAAKWAIEGVKTVNGDQFIAREDLSATDLIVSGLNIPASAVTEKYADRSEVKNTTARIAAARKKLVNAMINGKDVDEDIKEFNNSVPQPFKIKPDDVRRAEKARMKREAGETNTRERETREMLGR